MNIIQKLENFIQEKNVEAPHMLRTLFWMKELHPEADEVMQIAALCHDIERLFPLREGEIKPPKTYYDEKDGEYLTWHGKRSAEFAEKMLREFGYVDEEKLARIKILIAEHSLSGTKERDLIRDADCLSVLENKNQIAFFIKVGADKKQLKEKFISEYNTILNPEAKKIAKPLLEKALEDLKKVEV